MRLITPVTMLDVRVSVRSPGWNLVGLVSPYALVEAERQEGKEKPQMRENCNAMVTFQEETLEEEERLCED